MKDLVNRGVILKWVIIPSWSLQAPPIESWLPTASPCCALDKYVPFFSGQKRDISFRELKAWVRYAAFLMLSHSCSLLVYRGFVVSRPRAGHVSENQRCRRHRSCAEEGKCSQEAETHSFWNRVLRDLGEGRDHFLWRRNLGSF